MAFDNIIYRKQSGTTEVVSADAHLRATEAAAPKPRVVLKEALAKLSEARGTLSKLERAVPAARSGVAEAEARHDAANAAVAEAEGVAAERVATGFFTGTKLTPAPSAAAARAELAAAVDVRIVARNATAILDPRLKDARSAVGFANDRCSKAARGVLAAEWLENLLTEATETRAAYLKSVGLLGWLLRNHAIRDGDARPRKFLSDANTPPRAWPEANTAGTQQMESALAALLADPRALVA